MRRERYFVYMIASRLRGGMTIGALDLARLSRLFSVRQLEMRRQELQQLIF
jgi:hypothetical protein